jgi:transcriptional regulator
MYHLPYFKEKDFESVAAFMRAHPFVVLAGCDAAGKPVVTQVPLLMTEKDGQFTFRGHMMRKTDHHKAFEENPHVMAVFTGPHTYVSASWYSNPLQGSTWNYMTVQAKGVIRFLDEEALLGVLKETTTFFEGGAHTAGAFDNLPQAYVQPMVKAIVAFEIAVTNIENVFKLSQNRDAASYDHIIEKLQEGDADAQTIAREMEVRRSQLFK